MNDLEPLPPRLAELLDAERQRPGPDATTRARLFERLGATLSLPPGGGGGGGGGGGQPGATVPPPASGVLWAKPAAVAALAWSLSDRDPAAVDGVPGTFNLVMLAMETAGVIAGATLLRLGG